VGISLLPDVYSRCLPGLQRSDSWGGVAPRDLLRSDADFGPLYKIFDANDPGALNLHVPVFIGVGTADSAFPPALVRTLVDRLRANGAKVKYRTYEGIEHGGPEMLAAYSDYARFIAARFGGSR
jgi:dienelactone hydrolase